MIVGIILVFRDIAERRQRETALDATLQRTQDLYETCRRIGLVSNPDEVVQALLTTLYLNHATQCAILTFNTLWNHERPERYEVTAASSVGNPLVGFDMGGSLAGSSLANLLSRNAPIFIEDAGTDARLDHETRNLFAITSTRSMMIFPLTVGHRCFGMLLIYFALPQHWSQDDYRHIKVFVDQVCVTMDNVRLFAAEALARLEAEQANQMKLKFLAMISHELRTPLASIKGFATTLLATDVTWDAESQRDFVAIIDEESDKLTDLISQLLDLSRLQAGKLRIQPVPRRLNEIIGTAMAQLESISAQHRLVIKIASDLPPMMADTQRIAQVLVNLVSNAAKYAPRATKITVSATTQGANLQITVSDEGPGIPIANRESVFEAFLQLENSPLQQGKGLGLGLAICKGLIEAHGGKIWIADTSSGTAVSFTLPIATPQ
jgi:K+-sensing histidine kinase KdpD